MKILWITLESILPTNTGGRIGVYKRLEQIAKTEEIYLFYPYDKEEELKYVKDLEKICKKVYIYSRQENKKNALKYIWKYPYTVSSRKFPNMTEDINKCIEENDIDIINVDFPHMCVNLENIHFKVPVILNEHNVEWKVYKTIAKSHRNILKKIAYFIDSFRLEIYEKNLFKNYNFSRATFVSSKDLQFMVDHKIVNPNKAVLIPVGADIQQLKEKDCVQHYGQNIVFVGKMSYGPNIEAVMWFAENVLPGLLRTIPNLKFYIVGRDPSEEVKKLESKNIVVTGMVDDVSKYYEIADLVVIPLKNGGGVKVKLLEAISFKKPIVSTPVGVEGTYYAKHFIPIANDSIEFLNCCEKILKNEMVYPEKNIYEYFISNYTWKGVGEKYLNILREVINEKF